MNVITTWRYHLNESIFSQIASRWILIYRGVSWWKYHLDLFGDFIEVLSADIHFTIPRAIFWQYNVSLDLEKEHHPSMEFSFTPVCSEGEPTVFFNATLIIKMYYFHQFEPQVSLLTPPCKTNWRKSLTFFYRCSFNLYVMNHEDNYFVDGECRGGEFSLSSLKVNAC